MAHLLTVEFSSTGPFGADAADAYSELATDIAQQDGLIWKVWTEDAANSRAGGVYLFVDEPALDRYVTKHTARLASFGITDAEIRSTPVNADLSQTTHASLG